MSLLLNRTLLQQTDADSGALTMLAAVVHRPRSTGDHAGTVYRGEQAVGEFTLRVLEEPAPLQVHVDLATQGLRGEARRSLKRKPDDACCDDETGAGVGEAPVYSIGQEGHVVFHVSTGAGGYSVQLAEIGQAGRREEARRDESRTWDSRELEEGDHFAVTLLRPGTYRVSREAGAKAEIRLAYPQRGKTAYRPPEALHVSVTDRGFEPERIELQPLQGQVFEIGVRSRLTISLVEPDDGPQRGERPDRPRPPRYTLLRRAAPGEPGPG